MTNQELFELADTLKSAKEQKKDLEKQVKDLNARIDEMDKALSDAMAESELEKFTRNGSTFYLSSRLFASPRADMKEEMFEALIDHGYGDLITRTVNANTLASFCKEQREANKDEIPDWLAEVVNTHDKVTVGIRKG
ncbi:MAG: hypothetical protein SPL56_09595 [Lachnospiraceae bacterium]|nr:hypothetical protein [Lachnospiraceae bacterium]